MPTENPFQIALHEARKALEEALEERSLIERRIVNLKQSIEGLSALCEPEPDEDWVQVSGGNLPDGYNTSLTDAIRWIFSESKEYMLTAPEIRDALQAMGVNLAKYKQPLVPIHNTLKRLVAQGELAQFRDDADDLRGYRWVSPLARAMAEVDAHRSMKKVGMVRVNPGATNRLETVLRLQKVPVDQGKLPPDVATAVREPQKKK